MKVERSDVRFPLWRKKVDSSLFNKLDTPVPNWLATTWRLPEIFGINTSKKDVNSEVLIEIDKEQFKGWVMYSKYQHKDTNYKLYFTKELAEKLKDLFIMSYMRSLENKLRRDNKKYLNNIEDDIPFWEFLDLEFDSSNKVFKCKAHYTQKPIFPELFKQFVNSHMLRELENKLTSKGDFKFIKSDWLPKSDVNNLLERGNIIYFLIDTKDKLLYIGEADTLKRLKQHRKEVPNWDFFRIDYLPQWLTRLQRLELERLIIRSYATVLSNNKTIFSMKISDYTLANKKIDS